MIEVTCHEVQDRLADFLNGVLDTDTAQHFRWHMAACEYCRKRLREERRAIQEFLARPASDAGAKDATK